MTYIKFKTGKVWHMIHNPDNFTVCGLYVYRGEADFDEDHDGVTCYLCQNKLTWNGLPAGVRIRKSA